MSKSRTLLVTALAFACFALASFAQARAASELCPAEAGHFSPIGSVDGAATSYAYDLSALSPRIVDATIIADTDKGWYAWRVIGAQIGSSGKDQGIAKPDYVKGAPMPVSFPVALTIRHAWVTKAKTTGEVIFGWDKLGEVPCDVPVFADAPTPIGMPHTLQTPMPLPSPGGPALNAQATSPPFETTLCARQFVQAWVTHAADIQEPANLRSLGLVTPVSTTVAVVVGKDGKPLDTWIYESTGYPVLDNAALAAARASSYSPAVSYCFAVKAMYFFKAVFSP